MGVVESEVHCDGREYAAAVAVVDGTLLVGAHGVAHHPLDQFRCATVFGSVDRLAPPRVALVRPDLTAITLVTRRPEPLVERLREAGVSLR